MSRNCVAPLALGERPGGVEQAIGQRALAVVDVRDDAEVADALEVGHAFVAASERQGRFRGFEIGGERIPPAPQADARASALEQSSTDQAGRARRQVQILGPDAIDDEILEAGRRRGRPAPAPTRWWLRRRRPDDTARGLPVRGAREAPRQGPRRRWGARAGRRRPAGPRSLAPARGPRAWARIAARKLRPRPNTQLVRTTRKSSETARTRSSPSSLVRP